MKLSVSFVSVVIAVCVVGTLALIILSTLPDICPSTSFRCDEDNKCMDNRYLCDGVPHCSSDKATASDELPIRCVDMTNILELMKHMKCGNNSEIGGSTIPENTTLKPVYQANENGSYCSINFPEGCTCKWGSDIKCTNTNWTQIEWDKFHVNTTKLLLSNAMVGDWEESVANYTNFTNLKVLQIDDHYDMKKFPYRFLKNNARLTTLYLENNGFEVLEDNSFEGQERLCILELGNNSIRTLAPSAFSGLDFVRFLDLKNNRIQFDKEYELIGLPNLRVLFIENNLIEEVGERAFKHLELLAQLHMNRNRIKIIHREAFRYNVNLAELDISGNRILEIHPNTFTGQIGLQKLNIGENPFRRLSPALFSSQRYLRSLDLEELDLENIDLAIFSLFRNLKFVYLKKFEYCQYVPNVPNCTPSTDGFSSIQNLLNGTFIRIAVWVTALTTIMGNTSVLVRRWLSRRDSKILDIFISNLAVADFLMGLYLVIIGIKDIQYRDHYNSYAYTWTNSWECAITGILAMVSSEVSLLILTIMALERYLVISGPFSYQKLTRRWAIFSMCLIWGFAGILAITPAIVWNSSLASGSGLCFTLHLHDPYSLGWEYNAFIFIALNSACLSCIAIFYGRLFWVVRETSSSTPVVTKDVEMAIRFFLMVLTEGLRWVPIIILKISVFQGYRIPQRVLAWITIVVLPLNSVINPMLYTFSTGRLHCNFLSRLRFIFQKGSNKNVNAREIDAKMVTPEATTGDSRLHSSNGWRRKHTRQQSCQFKLNPRKSSASSNVSIGSGNG